MNFFSKFSSVAGAVSKPPRRPRLVAVWVIDPRTGKPRRVWRAVADREGSCTRRPGGPLHPLRRAA